MKIINLMEDTKRNDIFINEHGFSIYIETQKHRLLIDTGASENTWKNAERHNLNINDIDMVILSHGHYDHSGGIMSFNELNKKAKIFMTDNAALDYYALDSDKVRYIGIDKEILNIENCAFSKEYQVIDDEISMFGNVIGRNRWPSGNLRLKVMKNGELVQDNFSHEQYAVINSDNAKILVSGCAHNGILNILEKYRGIYGNNPDMVISGFHMMKNGEYTEDEIDNIRQTAFELKKTETIYYTGHCTSISAYEIMKEIMGNQIRYMHSGDIIEL